MTLSAAIEQSTYVITVAFTDEDGNAVAPSSATWTLTDLDGGVINSRQDVVVSPASSVDIILSGNDLALQSGERHSATRKLLIEAVYDSDAGSDLPFKAETEFTITDLVAL